jgi:hypothetical protein
MRAIASFFVLVSAATMADIGSAAIPPDFRVEAIFGAGGGGALATDETTSIVLTITADGKARLKSAGYYRHDQRISTRIETSRLSAGRLDEMVAVTLGNRFFSLPPDMDGTEDSMHYVLTITANGRKHRVDVTPPFDKIPELRRFRAVWISVMQAMPSPLGIAATKHLQKYI